MLRLSEPLFFFSSFQLLSQREPAQVSASQKKLAKVRTGAQILLAMTFGAQAQPKMARALGDDFFGAKDWLAHHACLANKFCAGLLCRRCSI
jgi:hypothetical protein